MRLSNQQRHHSKRAHELLQPGGLVIVSGRMRAIGQSNGGSFQVREDEDGLLMGLKLNGAEMLVVRCIVLGGLEIN